MSITVQLDWKDYLDSSRLHMRAAGWPGIVGVFPLTFLAFIFLCAGVLWLVGGMTPELADSLSYIWPVAAVVAGLVFLFNYVYLPWNARRIFQQQKDLSKPYELSITPDALVSSSEYGYATRPWGDFRKWKEDQKLLLLYYSDILYTIIPKRAMSAEQLADIRARLSEHQVPDARHVSWTSTAPGKPGLSYPQRFLVYLLLVIAIGVALYLGFRQPVP